MSVTTQEHTGELRVLGQAGDTRITWSRDDPTEVAAARAHYHRLLGEEFRAFAVDQGGGAGREITEFDPSAERVIIVPPMAGGAQ